MEFEKPEYRRPELDELSNEYIGEEPSDTMISGKGKVFEKISRESFEETKSEFEAFFDALQESIKRLDLNMIKKENIEEELKKVATLAENLKREARGLESDSGKKILERSKELLVFFSIVESMWYRVFETLREVSDMNFEGPEEGVQATKEEARAFGELNKKLQEKYEQSFFEIEYYVERLEKLQKETIVSGT